jgi:hypothetical protein
MIELICKTTQSYLVANVWYGLVVDSNGRVYDQCWHLHRSSRTAESCAKKMARSIVRINRPGDFSIKED